MSQWGKGHLRFVLIWIRRAKSPMTDRESWARSHCSDRECNAYGRKALASPLYAYTSPGLTLTRRYYYPSSKYSGFSCEDGSNRDRGFTPFVIAPDDYMDPEESKDYKPGGYLRTYVGDILCERYLMLKKLGWGHFSVVWLCYDKEFVCRFDIS